MKYIFLVIAMVPVLCCASAIDTTAGSGWYQISGLAWSGIDLKHDSQYGFAMGLGRWYNLGKHPHVFLTTPLTMQIGLGSEDSETGLIGFNPQVALEIGRVIISIGSGVTKYYASHNAVTYGQVDGSITVVVSDKGFFGGEITLAGRYLPGNRHKTLILGLTLLD